PTMFHEVVHQLFAAKPGTPRPGSTANFWIIEGVACYFESLALHDDYAELGDQKNVRIVTARYRRLVDDVYVPLLELTAMSPQKTITDLKQNRNLSSIHEPSIMTDATIRPWKLSDTNYAYVKANPFNTAVLPLSATEPHNLHLPYGTDTFQCDEIGDAVCAAA